MQDGKYMFRWLRVTEAQYNSVKHDEKAYYDSIDFQSEPTVFAEGEAKLLLLPLSKESAESFIPKGIYCYDEKGLCPFWDKFKELPNQSNGYCHFLEVGDFSSSGTFLLWDQCKECGIKDDIDYSKILMPS